MMSPATGTSSNPSTSTGIDGPALLTRLPLSSNIARIFPTTVPAMTESPMLSVPFFIKTVATGPRPLSSFASITVPTACFSGLALSSFISVTSKTASSKSFIPAPVFADTGTIIVSPPQSSARSSYSLSCCLTLSRFAAGLSTLFIATIIETSAALAWFMASTVCGITPSSAATTIIATSVTFAPRALMAVNASCPGVSINVIVSLFTETV